jgi:hypothetical protein
MCEAQIMYFRMYHIDPSGHFKDFKEIETHDDETAIAIAQREAAGAQFELWNEARLVMRHRIAASTLTE